MKKRYLLRKCAIGLASVAVATLFLGNGTVAADEATSSPTQSLATNMTTMSTESPIAAATAEINIKSNTPVIPVENAQVGDVVKLEIETTNPTVIANESTANGTDSKVTTQATTTIKTTSLAEKDAQPGVSQPVTTTQTASQTEETDKYIKTTTETVKKTTTVEIVKEADVINRHEEPATSDIVFVIDKSLSMDSHITAVANNIEKFVRDLSTKNITARLGLVDYEKYNNVTYHDFAGTKFTTDPDAFIAALKTIRTGGATEEATTPLSYIATSPDYSWGTDQNNHRFAILITDEDIDLSPYTPSKEDTLKALQAAGISLTVLGKKDDKADFDSLVNGTNGLFLDIKNDFSESLNTQFSNLVTETVIEGRVYRIQTDIYEMLVITRMITKPQTVTPEIPTNPTPTTPTKTQKIQTTVLQPSNQGCSTPSTLTEMTSTPNSSSTTASVKLPETGSNNSMANFLLGLISLTLGLVVSKKPNRNP